jgi:hypothetical protein
VRFVVGGTQGNYASKRCKIRIQNLFMDTLDHGVLDLYDGLKLKRR